MSFDDFNYNSNRPKNEEDFPNQNKIKEKLEEANRAMKEMNLFFNPETQTPVPKSEKYPWLDDMYPYKTSTKWPPMKDWNPTISSTEPTDSFLNDYKKWDHSIDSFKNQEERISQYNNDFAERLKKIDFKVSTSLTELPPEHTHAHSISYVYTTIGSGVGILVLLILIALSIKKKDKRARSGTVLSTGGFVGQGPVQRNQEIGMMLPKQGGAVPPNIGLPRPYPTDPINMTGNEEPPPYPRDNVPLVRKNDFVEIGFRNDCVPITTAPNDPGVKKLGFDGI